MDIGKKVSKLCHSFILFILTYLLCSCSVASSFFPTPTLTPTITLTPTSTPTPIYTITPISFSNLDINTPQPVPKATLISERIYPTPVAIPTFEIVQVTVTPTPFCVGNCSNITIDNSTGSVLTINLSGPITILNREIPIGTTTIAVPPGSYTLSVSASCGNTSDFFNLLSGQTQSVRYWCS